MGGGVGELLPNKHAFCLEAITTREPMGLCLTASVSSCGAPPPSAAPDFALVPPAAAAADPAVALLSPSLSLSRQGTLLADPFSVPWMPISEPVPYRGRTSAGVTGCCRRR